MISDHAGLKAAIEDWLADDTVAARTDDFIGFAENRLYRRLRIRTMEKAYSEVIASGTTPVPSDYIEFLTVYIDGSPTTALERVGYDGLTHRYPVRSADGRPTVIARNGEVFEYGRYPDSDYTVKGVYYSRPANLSATNTTNWFTANAPELLLFGALIEAAPYIRDNANFSLWEARYQGILNEIQEQDDGERHSGSALRVVSG
jgi:hypothetical protein